jgi:Lipoprotein confined to pathogenic Mycobacterium
VRYRGVFGVAALVGAVSVSSCHYDPYPWPRPGDPSAKPLESQLNERDSLQDAANDLIAVAAEAREAVQRAYPATHWTAVPGSHGGEYDCGPPFTFLPGGVYELPEWTAPAPASADDRAAVVTAVADVLKAHHADQVSVTPGQAASGALPREHGTLKFSISTPVNAAPPLMGMSGVTGCHIAVPGPGPWDTPASAGATP